MSKQNFNHSDLVGEWSGKAPDKSICKYVFYADGSVTNVVEKESFVQTFGPSGLKAKYVLREVFPFWEIDVYAYEDDRFKGIVLQCIMMPLEKGKFKMEGMPSHVGARPGYFWQGSHSVHKVRP